MILKRKNAKEIERLGIVLSLYTVHQLVHSSKWFAWQHDCENRNSVSKLLILKVLFWVLLDCFWLLLPIYSFLPIFLPMKFEHNHVPGSNECSWKKPLVCTQPHTNTCCSRHYTHLNNPERLERVLVGFGVLLGLLSCSILCINYSASPYPLRGSGGVSAGWIGLSEAEVRPALLIIGRSKYSSTAWPLW